MQTDQPSFLYADWPAPKHVHAVTTLRYPGASQRPYCGFNLGLHVGDAADHVLHNRQRLQQALQLVQSPIWLQQVHGTQVISLPLSTKSDEPPVADGSYTQTPGCVCVVLTADCLPVLLCDRSGTVVCALHVGWRGLLANIIETAIAQLPVAPTELLAWLGPAISQAAFEIGEDVKHDLASYPSTPESAFMRNDRGRWQADLPALARARLQASGVSACFGGDQCTFTDSQRFYSYRRDGETGRQASLIWLS